MSNEVKEVKRISKDELIVLLMSIEKPTFINLVTETNVRLNKEKTKEGNKEINPYYNQVIKRKNGNFLIGTDYEQRVNNNLEKEHYERTFEVSENKVGQHISKCVLYNENKNKHYLLHERFDEVKPKTEYLFENNSIEKVLFSKWESESNGYFESQPQQNKVKVQSVTIDNIKEISLEGTKYIIS